MRRTRAGLVYVEQHSAVHRGPDPYEPAETWCLETRRWTPFKGSRRALADVLRVLSEAQAERLMWPEFFAEQ